MQILLIIALLLGGTSVAAERALPGSALYGVKININERVADAFAMSAEADAKWHMRAAERRLEEAEKLAEKGEVSADVEAQLAANFQRHADMVHDLTAKIAADADAETAAAITERFSVSMKAHEAALARFGTNASVDATGSLRSAVRQEIERAENTNADANSNATVDVKVDIDTDGVNATGSSGIKIDIGGSSERQEGGGCTPPAPTSYGKSACCDTVTGQWYFAPAGCTGGSAI